MTEFTKGKWDLIEEPKQSGMCSVPAGHFRIETDDIYAFVTIQNKHRDESGANAHLIASAPDMYTMLEDLSGCFGQQDCSWSVSKSIEIDKLLTKARGEG